MSSSTGAGRPIVREAPTVGEHRRGARLRTTAAGTWFPAVGPDGEAAGLLLVHPGVDTKVLLPTIERLAELVLPGVLTPRPALVEQAGRNWLVTDAPPVPTLADVLGGDGPHQTPSSAAALLSDVAATLLATHRSGLAHGAVDTRSVLIGQDGAALLTDWGTSDSASAAADVRAWAKLAATLAEQWCAEDVESAAALARAVQAATGPTGLAGGFDQLRRLAYTAERATLAAAATDKLAALSGGQARPPRSARRAAAQAARAAAAELPDTLTPDTTRPDTGTPGTAAGGPPVAGAPDTRTPDTAAPDTGAADTGERPGGTQGTPDGVDRRSAWPAPPETPPPPPPPSTSTATMPPTGAPVPSAAPTSSHPQPPVVDPAGRPTATPEPAWATVGPPGQGPAPAAPWAPHPADLSDAEPRDTDPERSAGWFNSTGGVPRWQLVLLAVITVVTLLVGLADLVLLLTRATPDEASSSGLAVQSVSAWVRRDGATCTLVGLISTNGGSGTVTYGWTGDAAPGTAMTVQAHDGHPQIEVTQVWNAATATPDPVITLQVLKPAVQQASVQPASVCGR